MEIQRPECPLEAVLQVLSGKWHILILWRLSEEPHRYGALRRAIPDISERMLIRGLRELETHGLVHREQFPEVPPRVEYRLTERGHSLTPILNRLAAWGAEHLTAEAP